MSSKERLSRITHRTVFEEANPDLISFLSGNLCFTACFYYVYIEREFGIPTGGFSSLHKLSHLFVDEVLNLDPDSFPDHKEEYRELFQTISDCREEMFDLNNIV